MRDSVVGQGAGLGGHQVAGEPPSSLGDQQDLCLHEIVCYSKIHKKIRWGRERVLDRGGGGAGEGREGEFFSQRTVCW